MHRVVYLASTGLLVRKRQERLQVVRDGKVVEDLRLFGVDRVVAVGPVQFTTQALGLLLDQAIDVSFLTSTGRLRGSLVSTASRNVFLRLAQFERWKDLAFRLEFGRGVVASKIMAQRSVLTRYARNHPDRIDPEAIPALDNVLERVGAAATPDELRGLEGGAASLYYRQFGRMLIHAEFPGRRKRPSTDPANALLSLGYTFLGNELSALLEGRGFDPAIGFLHGIRYGRTSLALDLIEPFRQPIIDRLTLRLLNRKQFTAADFERHGEEVRLAPAAFKRYVVLYEETLRSPSEGSGTPSWRERLLAEVAALRDAVMTGKIPALYIWAG